MPTECGEFMLSARRKKIKDGLQILFKANDGAVPIAYIVWSKAANDCCLKTAKGARLQDYITTWKRYIDFALLADEAYDMMRAALKEIKQEA